MLHSGEESYQKNIYLKLLPNQKSRHKVSFFSLGNSSVPSTTTATVQKNIIQGAHQGSMKKVPPSTVIIFFAKVKCIKIVFHKQPKSSIVVGRVKRIF